MPFKKDSDGYYYYDSYKYDVKFPNNKPANNAKLEDEGLSKLSSDGKGAFLPFSKNNFWKYRIVIQHSTLVWICL